MASVILMHRKSNKYRRKKSKYVCLKKSNKNLQQAHYYHKCNRRRSDKRILVDYYKGQKRSQKDMTGQHIGKKTDRQRKHPHKRTDNLHKKDKRQYE